MSGSDRPLRFFQGFNQAIHVLQTNGQGQVVQWHAELLFEQQDRVTGCQGQVTPNWIVALAPDMRAMSCVFVPPGGIFWYRPP